VERPHLIEGSGLEDPADLAEQSADTIKSVSDGIGRVVHDPANGAHRVIDYAADRVYRVADDSPITAGPARTRAAAPGARIRARWRRGRLGVRSLRTPSGASSRSTGP
jgi:hypothetical protein